MSDKERFPDSAVVHLRHPVLEMDSTLCGDAHSAMTDMVPARGPVTCERCCTIVEWCRGVRIAPTHERLDDTDHCIIDEVWR